MTTQTPIIFETDPKDEATIYLRGLGLHVELNFADPGTRYNPDGAGILAQPDAMEGIVGHGATREAAAQACCDRLLELLRSPAEMFDALAAGAERAAGLEWAAAERHEHKDTPLNNEAHWHVIQRSTMQTAATLMRASQMLATSKGYEWCPACEADRTMIEGKRCDQCGTNPASWSRIGGAP